MAARSNKQVMIWGGLMILSGVLSLLDLYRGLSIWVWIAATALAGVVSFAVYLTDRSDWALLITTYALWTVALFLALIKLDVLDGLAVALYPLIAIAVPFIVVYVRNRSHWWALIPAYVLLAIGLMLLLTDLDILPGDFVATFVLSSIALPFIVVYLRDRSRWWALIPAYSLLVLGIMVGLIVYDVLDDLLIPAYVFIAVALPFLAAYVRTRYWWTLVPAGIMLSMAVIFLVVEGSAEWAGAVVMIVAGATLVARSLMRGKEATPAG